MDVLTAILHRRSVREYVDRPLDPAQLTTLKQALRAAPSACNFQPWHFIFVTDPTLRSRVAELAKRQLWMADAPLIIVALGFPQSGYKTMGGYWNSVDVDVAIALDHLTLAAAAEGLGTCWIGAFDEKAVKDLLAVPAEAKIVGLTPVGYPVSAAAFAPLDETARKPRGELFSDDTYQGG